MTPQPHHTPADSVAPVAAAPEGGKRHRRPAIAWRAIGVVMAAWILLWGDLTWGNLAGGLVVGYVVVRVFPMPPVSWAGHLSILGTLRLAGRLAVDIVIASVEVSGLALRRTVPRGAVIRIPLRSRSDLYMALTADLVSLVPGSIIVEAHRSTSTLYVHVLDVALAGGIDEARADVLNQEARVLYAVGSDAEIAAAGLPPRRLGGQSHAIREVSA